MVMRTSVTIVVVLVCLLACHMVNAYTVNFAPKTNCGYHSACPPPICMPTSCSPMMRPPLPMGPRCVTKVKPRMRMQTCSPMGYPQMIAPQMGQPQPGLSGMYGWR